jgi:surface antigen
VRPHGRWYGGYGWHRGDDDAYKWLSFTAITLKLLDNLNEQQQREHEAAQVRATGAAVGETIVWHEGDASGAVTVQRDGTSTTGRYCREFQQEVRIGGNAESAYGTACRNPDGSWEVVSTGTP